MSFVNQTQTNVTGGQRYQGLLERMVLSSLIAMPCFIFLIVNGVMLFTLRSKPAFRDTSRYILLYNLLFADTVQIAQTQLLYILAMSRTLLAYPVCGFLLLFANLANEISPLTLAVMSLERYVAVCYPLRHSTIVTIRNTGMAVLVVWTISFFNVLIRIIIGFSKLQHVKMIDVCSNEGIIIYDVYYQYDKAYTCFVFVTASVAITSSYIGVTLAARSASTDKASAHKARNTLLLHLVQLGLTLCSTMHSSLMLFLSTVLPRLTIVRIKSALYVFIYVLPRCMSSLIYGLRDQTIRTVLMYYLCCRLKLSQKSES